MDFADSGLGPGDLREARSRIARAARTTPLLPSLTLGERFGHPVALKCENLQAGGAFKIRGASNFVARLDDAGRARGLITYSSGNHAIAVALTAKRSGCPAVIVMPETAPAIKKTRVRDLGAELHFAGTTSPERKVRAEALAAERGLTMVPPFDHPHIVQGQSTCGTEILEQSPDLGVVLVPVGGGGLLSGIALACAYHRPGIRVVGVEPQGAAKMSSSLRAQAPITLPSVGSIADGLLPSRPGDLTFAITQHFVESVVTVPDDAIAEAARTLLRDDHLLVEWSGAVGLAALMTGAVRTGGAPTVLVLSGGNAEPAELLAGPGSLRRPAPGGTTG
ncbi:MAG TPA: threonine/serine dehydratase [Candidatus Polarisedimenticolia bacterium]|nr:threonine/serine dehydratase [Candidatus Polarisedimenticolia bacterium]